jgi:hypothetical protein
MYETTEVASFNIVKIYGWSEKLGCVKEEILP